MSTADRFRHHLNPLHLYCRLMNLGLNKLMATRICNVYTILYRYVL